MSTFDLVVVCVAETTKAIKVYDGTKEFWVPKSVVHEDSEVWKTGQEGTLIVAEWWAEKEGL